MANILQLTPESDNRFHGLFGWPLDCCTSWTKTLTLAKRWACDRLNYLKEEINLLNKDILKSKVKKTRLNKIKKKEFSYLLCKWSVIHWSNKIFKVGTTDELILKALALKQCGNKVSSYSFFPFSSFYSLYLDQGCQQLTTEKFMHYSRFSWSKNRKFSAWLLLF